MSVSYLPAVVTLVGLPRVNSSNAKQELSGKEGSNYMPLLQAQKCGGVREATSRTKRKHFTIFHLIGNSTINPIVSYAKTLNDASRLCFGASASCFVVGTLGWIVNFLAAGTTMLHGLLVVAVFYFLLGVINLFEKQTNIPESIEQKSDFDDHALPNDKDLTSEEKRLEAAA